MEKEKRFILYRIYYGDDIVYLGRTKQPLQDRIRGHLFKKPMLRSIYIDLVSKIEYAEFNTEADMNVYEVYFINLLRPPLNRDDKAHDSLTISLPQVEWKLFSTPLWEKWRKEIEQKDLEEEEKRKRKAALFLKQREMRKMWREGKITEEEYYDFLEKVDKESQLPGCDRACD